MKKSNKVNKKVDSMKIFTKILASLLVVMTLGGACFSFVYLLLNS